MEGYNVLVDIPPLNNHLQLSPGPLLPNNVPLQNNEDEGVPINVELPDQQPELPNQQPPNNNVPTTGQQQVSKKFHISYFQTIFDTQK